ncbi:MAG: ABC transporter substrate-binding protein, partial [Acidimicrobiales bacterium]
NGGTWKRSFVGVVTVLVLATAMAACSSDDSSSAKSNLEKIKSAQEQFKAKNGVYGTQDELVSAGFLAAAIPDTDVILITGKDGKPKSEYSVASGTINAAANADQWVTSDSGSGPGYSSSAFAYPLNSNLAEPLILMASDFSLQPGLAASWEAIPVGTNRNTIKGMGAAGAALPSSPTPYPTCGGIQDRPFCSDTWRFHLRQGVTFHDGAKFDADDLIWTWRDRQPYSGSPSDGENTMAFSLALPGAAGGCATNLTLCGFDSVEKIDEFTVDFTPRAQNLRFPEQVLHPKGAIAPVLRDSSGKPMPAPDTMQTPGLSSPRNLGRHLDGSTGGIAEGSQAFGKPPLAAVPLQPGTPQGTGPFKYVSYNPTTPQGGGTAAFVANTNYWGSPAAQVHAMNYTFIADPAVRTAGLQAGTYDLNIDINPLDTEAAKASGKNVVSAPYGQNSLIYVNKVVKVSPENPDKSMVGPSTPGNYTFNIGTDPKVRQAVSLGIDRQAVVSAIYAGNAAPGRWMSPPGVLGSFQDMVPQMKTDIAQARTILDADGWTCGNANPGANTACGNNEIRTWRGDGRFTAGRKLTLYMIGISLVPQSGYDLLQAQMKTIGIDLVTQRGSCDGAVTCTDGTVGRGQMYNSSMWDLDLELPNQNDANAAFLPVLRQACASATNFRFAPADGTNAVGPPVNDSSTGVVGRNNGGGVFPFGNTPCSTQSDDTHTPAKLGPMDAEWVPASNNAKTATDNQRAAANMMRILVGQDQTNVVIPVVGQYRLYGMAGNVKLGDPHPSQTSQRWTSLTKSASP